jgi:hypothetical protein
VVVTADAAGGGGFFTLRDEGGAPWGCTEGVYDDATEYGDSGRGGCMSDAGCDWECECEWPGASMRGGSGSSVGARCSCAARYSHRSSPEYSALSRPELADRWTGWGPVGLPAGSVEGAV